MLAALAACACAYPAPSVAATVPAGFQDGLVTTGVDRPTSLAFTPDGRLLIGAEAGTVHVQASGSLTTALDISSRTCSDQERGLMSVAVDPSFSTNNYIYVYYTFNKFGGPCEYGSNGSTTTPVNRISRFVLGSDNTADPAGEVVLVDNIPAPEGFHIGADLHFGKDGFLYASTGDGGCDYVTPVWCEDLNDASRDEHVLLGKVLRITRNGGIPAGNPFQGAGTARCNTTGMTDPGKRCQETYAWGLRNPFRMAFDPNATGTRFFINDVGEQAWEEIDLGQAGADYGWNVREGFCATGSTTSCAPVPGMTDPIYAYGHSTGCSSITGGAFVPSGTWPLPYEGAYLYGDLVCGKMVRLSPVAGGGFTASDFATGFGPFSVITMTFGPHVATKALYYVTWGATPHQVRRIAYTGRPARISATPLRVALVPSFRQTIGTTQCQARGGAPSTHGAPLNFTSCDPPGYVPGTAARLGPGSSGFADLTVLEGDLVTAADEADVSVSLHASDVRDRQSGGDYLPSATGPDVTLKLKLRVSDDANGSPAVERGTITDFSFDVPVSCTATAGIAGSTCDASTSADSVLPGMIREGKDTVIQAFRARLDDSGANRVRGDGDDRNFAMQGLYIP